MTEAKVEALVPRIVVGTKPFHAEKDGKRYVAQPGETVMVRPRVAQAFTHLLVAPEVQKAREEARKAEEEAAKKAAAPSPVSARGGATVPAATASNQPPAK